MGYLIIHSYEKYILDTIEAAVDLCDHGLSLRPTVDCRPKGTHSDPTHLPLPPLASPGPHYAISQV